MYHTPKRMIRGRMSTTTIKWGHAYCWLHPATGTLGISRDTAATGLVQWLAYERAGFQRIGRRSLPYSAPTYTRGGPDRFCTPAQFRRAALGRPPAAKRLYYVGPDRALGIGTTDDEQTAYEQAGYMQITYRDALRFSRAQGKNPELGYRFTVGGPNRRMTLKSFRTALNNLGKKILPIPRVGP